MRIFRLLTSLLLVLCITTLSAQTVNTNLYYSTNDTRTVGMDLTVIHPNNMVFGIGGSHASRTFFTSETKDGNDYSDHSLNIASQPGVTYFGYFIENRGTLTGIIGYSFNKKRTTLLSDLGISFRQKIHTGNIATPPVKAPNGFYWKSETLNPKFLYGGTITQTLSGRLGLLAGYNNIQQFKLGITYRITPTSLFKL